jgi:2-polyprenyl-6-methoxyphenol hydroxylase-like FAD-dependent oxidoreductase
MAITNGATNGTKGHTINYPSSQPLPIVISGGGCVGLFLGLLLANSSIPNKIIVIEPQTPDVTSTRAMAHQPPTYPILSRVPGLLPELIKAGSLSSGLCFRTSIACGSKVIAEKRFNNEGEGMKGKGQLLLPQGKFQEVLMKRLAALDGKAEVRIGSSVTGFSQHASSVSVNISDTREETTIEASYLLAADGSHSLIRKALGIPFEGETLDAQLVALDLHFPFSEHGFHDANFIIDPINYGLIGRILPATPPTPALWRVSYGAPLGLSEAEIKDRVDEKLRTMLPNAGRNEDGQIGFEVVRVAPYKAQQLLASTLYTQRVCLVGDAAHLTNPYAGLGLASGIADAASLAMVLEHVLIGKAKDTETLLHAWSEARRQKFSSVVDKPSRMAYKRVRTDVGTDERLQELLSKDPMVGALKKGMPVMPPSLETNGEELEGW